MMVRERPQVVVLGRLSTMPYGGVVWQTLHYLMGLERLGFEAFYVEAHAVSPRQFVRGEGDAKDDGAAAAAAFLERTLGRFGFGGRWAFHALHSDGRVYGLAESKLAELYSRAAAILNLHGGTLPRPEQSASGRLICVATDPVEIELELDRREPAILRFLEAHRRVFTFGENYGTAEGRLPVAEGFTLRPTRQPVVLDLWQTAMPPSRELFTTIANWHQNRELKYEGRTYEWSKDLEFLKLLDLPSITMRPLELALSRCPPKQQRLLRENGWRVVDALAFSRDVDAYRGYIRESLGEFTVAKDQNVRFRTGWFSDRSATYLAAARPVVTQDTGFGANLPTGEGLFAWTTVDEAAAALDAIASDWERHSRAAFEIARREFAHDVVLVPLLTESGVELPRARRRGARDRGLRVMLVSHRFPPDALGGVERYTEKLSESLLALDKSVAVLTRRPDPGALRREVELRRSGLPVHVIAGVAPPRERFLSELEGGEQLVREALAECDPEVVHVNHLLDLSPGILRAVRERGAALVLTLHDYYFACQRIVLRTVAGTNCAGPEGGVACARDCFGSENGSGPARWALRTTYFRRLLQLADRVVCPSEYVGDFFLRHGAPADRLRVVPNGVWLDKPMQTSADWSTPRERGRLVLAFLGAVVPHKGLKVVLEALAMARLEAVDLTAYGVIGDDECARELYALAADIPGLRFRMYGDYDTEHLPVLLRDIDSIVVPSLWPETFCLVAREALVRGIPAIVSRMGALPDGVTDGRNGFVFDHERADELAVILRRLVDDDSLVSRLRSGARSSAVPSLAEHTAAIVRVYGEALDESGRHPGLPASDRVELAALEQSLLALGFGGSASFAPPPLSAPSTTPRLEVTS
jgi:glycosyltransferase involved in cell wall biosynthesis